MRKLHKAVVVVAALGSISFIGAGTASADGFGQGGEGFDITQLNNCRTHDSNLGLADDIGVANGLLGGAVGGEGNPGAQEYKSGSTLGCDNQAFNQTFGK